MDANLTQAVEALNQFHVSDDEQRARVAARRAHWKAVTRQTIEDSLNEIVRIAEKNERGLHVDPIEMFDDFSGVQLRFGNINTWIRGTTSRGGSAYGIERGAVLVFSQNQAGRIGIIRYPFASELPDEDRAHRNEYNVVGMHEPEDVTREVVLREAKEFFQWAAATSYRSATPSDARRIGFVHPRVD